MAETDTVTEMNRGEFMAKWDTGEIAKETGDHLSYTDIYPMLILRDAALMLDTRLAYISDQLKAVEDLLIDQSSPKIKVTQAYIEGGTVDER